MLHSTIYYRPLLLWFLFLLLLLLLRLRLVMMFVESLIGLTLTNDLHTFFYAYSKTFFVDILLPIETANFRNFVKTSLKHAVRIQSNLLELNKNFDWKMPKLNVCCQLIFSFSKIKKFPHSHSLFLYSLYLTSECQFQSCTNS